MDKRVLDFLRCTKKAKSGRVFCIQCKLGLWSVMSPDEDEALREAYHYWQQYADDGEYSSIIGGSSVIENLTPPNN